MTLADRLNKIIDGQDLTKREFAKRIGITEQYVYLLTGSAKTQPQTIKPALAKLIALEFGYDAEWILFGDKQSED